MKDEKAVFQENRLAEWTEKLREEELRELEQIFRRDHHGWWRELSDGNGVKCEDRRQQAEEAGRMSEAVHRWRTVFEQTELLNEEHKRQAGGSAGAGTEQIVIQKERGYDYRRFLKQFAVEREELALDMDSFDYIPYDYSRKMYSRLVFLEPLEYKNMRRLQEFVIAIDTSGS